MSQEADGEVACRELVGLVTEYLELGLTESDRIRFESQVPPLASSRGGRRSRPAEAQFG
jgi:hypothetical protein